jgi:methyl-accepting chemotaxis protein
VERQPGNVLAASERKLSDFRKGPQRRHYILRSDRARVQGERFNERTTRLAQAAQQSDQAGEAIKGEVCESLVQLQFQDRVGQILQHVVGSMRQVPDLPATAAAGGNASEQVQRVA